MSETLDTRQAIVNALAAFGSKPLAEAATGLLESLGYKSKRRFLLKPNTAENFVATFGRDKPVKPEQVRLADWQSVDFLFQLTDAEVRAYAGNNLEFQFEGQGRWNGAEINSFLFLAIGLANSRHNRTQLSGITRAVNRLFNMPVIVIFKHGDTLTLAITPHRLHKRDASKDVLEKVTLIKDIRFGNPHRGHIEILFDLSFNQLRQKHNFTNFVELQTAWQKTLDSSELNKRFFQEIANWYFWACDHVAFPMPKGTPNADAYKAQSLIRLITRLIFCWFVKEKGLIPGELFDLRALSKLLKAGAALPASEETTYYKAILQNLFFATLNQEMGKREFRKRNPHGRDPHRGITNLYRYEDYFTDPKEFLELMRGIPFLNGGLFECLDKVYRAEENLPDVRIDGFSDHPKNPLSVPDFLFFGDEREVDLSSAYGEARYRRARVRGLIHIFDRYKFTIAENTPIEEEVALDPELSGKVFENLLAAYNPETATPARKQTGSFYTPREIVDYMVDEALLAYLGTKLNHGDTENTEKRLRHLLAYNDEPHQFSPAEVETLIAAIDNLKALDPACGSGAFPMGLLHKLVFILGKLDPHNEQWKQRQIAKASEIPDTTVREKTLADIEQAFAANELDYGRKLYLIENCIYGVDIQPIAVQIAKMRFFISLIVDQRVDDAKPNRGILSLPNLETKFVAANTLIGVEKPAQQMLRNPQIDAKEAELRKVRERHFTARTPATKAKCREQDAKLRAEISELLRADGFPRDATEKLARWDPYDQNASADFFDPEWMFGIREGFDIVIGNPPYVRADEQSEWNKAQREQILASGQYETLWEKWDLFVPFIERAYKLLQPGGVTTLIVSDAYCHSKYAQKSQTWFLQNARILRLDFCSNVKIFEAAVHNLIYLFQKADGSDNVPQRRLHTGQFGKVKLLSSDEQGKLTYRIFFPEGDQQGNFRSTTVPLESVCYISKGMVVNADEQQAQGAFKMEDVVSDKRDAKHPRRFAEGKHLGLWLPVSHKWLEWGTQRAPALFSRPTFSELHVAAEKILVQRSPGPDPKCCYDDKQIHFTESSVGFVPWHMLAGVRNKSLKKAARYRDDKPPRPDLPQREELEAISRRFAVKYLLAVMNSTVARDFLRANRRSNIHLYPDDWKKLPIPDVPPEQQTPIVKLVDKILTAKRADPQADVSAWEREIDQHVYRLYGLTKEEIAVVEGSAK